MHRVGRITVHDDSLRLHIPYSGHIYFDRVLASEDTDGRSQYRDSVDAWRDYLFVSLGCNV